MRFIFIYHFGGRFGYRLIYPPLRAGARDLFWHLPLVARLASGAAEVLADDPPRGYVLAEAPGAGARWVLTAEGGTVAFDRSMMRLLRRRRSLPPMFYGRSTSSAASTASAASIWSRTGLSG